MKFIGLRRRAKGIEGISFQVVDVKPEDIGRADADFKGFLRENANHPVLGKINVADFEKEVRRRFIELARAGSDQPEGKKPDPREQSAPSP